MAKANRSVIGKIERGGPAARHVETLRQGLALQRQNRLADAAVRYRAVLAENPRQHEAINLMGTVEMAEGRIVEAIGYFRHALREAPRQMMYLTNLGTALLASGDAGQAEQQYRRAVAIDPKSVDALCNLGRANRALNRAPEALQAYEAARRLDPGSTKAMLGLAKLLVEGGDMERAETLLRAVIATGRDRAEALVGLASVRKFQPEDPEPALMLEVLARPNDAPRQRAALHQAAGKAQADLENYDAAFRQFAAAKAISTQEFDLGAYRARHDRIIETMTPQFFDERQRFGLDTEVPIFIVGMPRSGTTLTEQICSSHSRVSGGGELAALGAVARDLGAREDDPGAFAKRLAMMTAGQSRDLAKVYLEQLHRFGGRAPHVTDKLPHNFEYLGLIALLFPKARVVHCTRNPLDTCVSCFTHHFSEAHGYNTDLGVLGKYYKEYRRLMAHWRAVLSIRMFENSYEALVADQEGGSRGLLAFLGLEWETACLDFYASDRLVKTQSRWQVRQPIYASSIAQWQKYQAHLGPLIESLGEFAGEAGAARPAER